MVQVNSYLTISKASEGIYKDRGSRFHAYAFPVFSEEEVKEHLAQLRRDHPSARHHCYAWRLDPATGTSRANDDGEPSSSAGKPILAQIQAKDLYCVLVVVARYFGGTLLGVNGLINAYRSAAEDAIANAEIREHFIMSEYKAGFDSDDLSAVMRLLKDCDAKIMQNAYDQRQEITFRIKRQFAGRVEQRFAELYKTTLEHITTL